MSSWIHSLPFWRSRTLRTSSASTSNTASRPTSVECIICRSDSNEVEFSPNSPTSVCSHPPQVCVGCLRQLILTAITNGDFLSGISCPSPECSQMLGYHDVQTWAPPEVFDRYALPGSLHGEKEMFIPYDPDMTSCCFRIPCEAMGIICIA